MHNDFADWYRICTTGTEKNLTDDLLVKRWQGVEKVTNDVGQESLELVRVTMGRPGVSAVFLAKLKTAFKEADATFQMSGNDLELSVLAGSALCQLFTEEADEADEAALGLLCAISVAKGPSWIEPFVSKAHDYLDRRLRDLRKPTEIQQPQLPTKKIKQQFEAFAARLAENQPAQISEATKQMYEALIEAMSTVTEAAAAAIDKLDKQSSLRRQETDVLWWLTAGISRDMGMTFKQLRNLGRFHHRW